MQSSSGHIHENSKRKEKKKILHQQSYLDLERTTLQSQKAFTVSILSKLQGWGHISKVDSHFRELQAKHAAYDKHLSAFVIKLPHF